MSDLLELPAVRKQVKLLSLEDYHRMGELGIISEKVELLRGIIVRKTSKSPLHEYVLQSLLKLLMRLAPAGLEVRTQWEILTRRS